MLPFGVMMALFLKSDRAVIIGSKRSSAGHNGQSQDVVVIRNAGAATT
jgi:hypothetical protein